MRRATVWCFTMTMTLLAFAVFPPGGRPQSAEKQKAQAPKEDRWKQWRPFVGVWEGTSEGKPGKGKIRLEISFVLNERFLKLVVISDYQNDKGGEHHEDFGFVSYDSSRKTQVFRQFHSEGFVNQYVLGTEPKGDGVLEFTSESCENAPGWKARERYQLRDDRLEQTFELAPPNKTLEVYSRATYSRAEK
jgi:hypothetical protein